MKQTEQIFLLIFCIYALYGFWLGYKNCIKNRNPFGYSNAFILLGAWVWGDALIFGIFWFLTALFIFITHDFILFLLITSVFWMLRSVGEHIYWLNQQFSGKERNPPKNLRFSNLFHNDSIWFIYQIVWQCIGVITLIASVYLFKLWLF